MKVKGIIFSDNTEYEPQAIKDVKAIFPGVIFVDDEIDNWEGWEEATNARQNKLDSITNKYMMGNDDAKYFYFTNDQEGLKSIQHVFPEFEIIEVNYEDYPWDYDYIRDLP